MSTQVNIGLGLGRALDLCLGVAARLRLGYEAHHIVAENNPAAENTRALLNEFDIPINSASNGIYLPGTRAVTNVNGEVVHRGD